MRSGGLGSEGEREQPMAHVTLKTNTPSIFHAP